MTEGLKNINKSKENSKKYSSNLQKGKEKSRAMKQKTNKKKKPTKYKMAILSSYISIITLNDLNISIRLGRDWQIRIFKKSPNYILTTRNHYKYKDIG